MKVDSAAASARDCSGMSESGGDRINDVYLGTLGSDEVRARAHRRLGWIREQVRGPRVLDVGCSGGILSVLLARDGHRVLGVDVRREAIDEAQALRAAEPAAVRDRLEFRVADLSGSTVLGDAFDTVVLGEVIEHLPEPRPLLENVRERLAPGSRLVLTTPFGSMPHPDHHQTFLLSSFAALVRPLFALESLTVSVPYILFVGSRHEAPAASWEARGAADQLLATTEAAYLCLQEEARARQVRYQRVDRLVDLLRSPRLMLQLPRDVIRRLTAGPPVDRTPDA